MPELTHPVRRAGSRELLLTLIALFVLLGASDNPARPPAAHARLAPDNDGALAELVLHFDPRAEAAAAPTYRDLLRALAPSVKVLVVVERAADFERFRALLATWRIAAPDRVHPVVVGKPITTWSRDRFTLLERGGRRVLLVRDRPAEGPAARQNDWLAPFALARAAGSEVEVERTPLLFDGGDLLATGQHVLATAVLLGRNRGGTLGDPHLLRRWLRATSGLEPILIGEEPEDVPPHHICMVLTALGGRTILVGDPAAGLALLPADAKLPLAVDRSEETTRRFERVAEVLTARGLRVVRVPLVPLSDGLTYLSYNNSIVERRPDGRLHAYVPQFGVPVLDAAGRAAYQREGVVVHPIDAREIYVWNGSVRCLVNVLQRE